MTTINIPLAEPLRLTGSAPTEQVKFNIETLELIKSAKIVMTVFDAEFADEGMLSINGLTNIQLFNIEQPELNNQTVVKEIEVDNLKALFVGENTLTFSKVRTAGYIINELSVVLDFFEPPIEDKTVDVTVSGSVESTCPDFSPVVNATIAELTTQVQNLTGRRAGLQLSAQAAQDRVNDALNQLSIANSNLATVLVDLGELQKEIDFAKLKIEDALINTPPLNSVSIIPYSETVSVVVDCSSPDSAPLFVNINSVTTVEGGVDIEVSGSNNNIEANIE